MAGAAGVSADIPVGRVECLWAAGHELGEGAIFWPNISSCGRFFHVDILGHAAYEHDVYGTGDTKQHMLPTVCTAIIPKAVGVGEEPAAVVCLRDGFYTLRLADSTVTPLALLPADTVPSAPAWRMNDAKAGPDGRVWGGTMATPPVDGAGSLYMLDHDGSVHVMLRGVTISNGLAWSPAGTTMYYIDTPTATVRAFDYDLASGAIANPRVVVTIDDPDRDGWPDGCCMDAEGHLWVAFWGGGCVRRFDVGTGKALATIRVPAKKVTSCAFGGPGLSDLYITTAWEHYTDAERAGDPQAGSVFLVRSIGVQGLPVNEYTHTPTATAVLAAAAASGSGTAVGGDSGGGPVTAIVAAAAVVTEAGGASTATHA